jgi:hypothetical protein
MLYKYIKQEHLELFFKQGTIKIGTLYKYRDEEQLGNVIGDKDEGTHFTELNSPHRREINLSDNSAEAHFFRQHVLRPEQRHLNVNVIMEAGAKIISQSHSPNYYLYCVTSQYDPEMMKEFECNACIEIIDPDKFFNAISKVMKHKGKYGGYHKVIYRNRFTDHLNPHSVHPALQKDTKYFNQHETRAIWEPIKKAKQDLFIKAPKAVKYCRVYKIKQ